MLTRYEILTCLSDDRNPDVEMSNYWIACFGLIDLPRAKKEPKTVLRFLYV